VWGSLLNAANKVTDTISSLTTNNSQAPQISRVVSGPPWEEPISNAPVTKPPHISTEALDAPDAADNQENAIRTKAIDTLGQGELSLSELGFDSDAGNGQNSLEDLVLPLESSRGNSGKETPVHAEVGSPLLEAVSGARSPPRRRVENFGRSRRSLTVPSRGSGLGENDSRFTAFDGARSRRLSNLSKDGSSHRDESVTSRESETRLADDTARQPQNHSTTGLVDGAIDLSPSQGLGTTDVAEDRENEDALYIHGKDGKKRKVPITGFAVQSGKRNRDFHALFKSVEESDYLIEGICLPYSIDIDYSCALSKEILVQGRMYISEHYICFNSNIFGWVTNVFESRTFLIGARHSVY
jgi:GRAM domain